MKSFICSKIVFNSVPFSSLEEIKSLLAENMHILHDLFFLLR